MEKDKDIQVIRDPITKERYYKLYRGAGEKEDADWMETSFTSDKYTAENFAKSYGGKVEEVWVPEKDIQFSMNHSSPVGASVHSGESEVISTHPGYDKLPFKSKTK